MNVFKSFTKLLFTCKNLYIRTVSNFLADALLMHWLQYLFQATAQWLKKTLWRVLPGLEELIAGLVERGVSKNSAGILTLLL
ncbi:MAG: hypothetical protein COA96_12575 [SAR86 cluster bacterium]|uniref:Uncharacterized protein n=1 Tax=SAR86 cluster bacterium TaxID=2030880 RepID=A0A2A5AV32_9GAMM|nr:MAG: hypothetical protein COA96_12575 [SAR86 cluster bacterium]